MDGNRCSIGTHILSYKPFSLKGQNRRKTRQNKPVPKWKVLLKGGVDGLDQGAAHAGILERDDALDGGTAG